jgi:hypothetical protein
MQQGLIGKRLLLLDTEYEKFDAESKQAVLDSATGKPVLAIDPEGVGVLCRRPMIRAMPACATCRIWWRVTCGRSINSAFTC